MKYQIRNLLVTGAAGFIGSNFVKIMLSRYSEIFLISLDKLTYAGNMNNLLPVQHFKNHIFVQGDILDYELVNNLLKQYNIDTIVHFAAESHVDNSIEKPQLFLETNIQGTFTLLEEAKKFWFQEKQWDKSQCRFHHVSTDEVYGSLNKSDPPFIEESAYKPNSPYSASKASSDHFVRAYFHTYGLPVLTSNCSNNFGPNQHIEKLIPKVINVCLAERPIRVYGNGTNVRDWLHVSDHCEAIDLILHRGVLGEAYNIGGNNELSNLSLIRTICQIMSDLKPTTRSYESLIEFVEDRKGHDHRYAINNTKIFSELGWEPKKNFHQALVETIEHYINLIQK